MLCTMDHAASGGLHYDIGLPTTSSANNVAASFPLYIHSDNGAGTAGRFLQQKMSLEEAMPMGGLSMQGQQPSNDTSSLRQRTFEQAWFQGMAQIVDATTCNAAGNDVDMSSAAFMDSKHLSTAASEDDEMHQRAAFVAGGLDGLGEIKKEIIDTEQLPTSSQTRNTSVPSCSYSFANTSSSSSIAFNLATSAPSSTSLTAPTKRGRPTENPCWNYFDRIDDQSTRCRICHRVVKSACATNMTKHLERHHSDDHHLLLDQIRTYRQGKPPVQLGSSIGGANVSAQMAASLNHLGHAPSHHLLQPMTSDGQLLSHQFQIAHQLPLSPDPSPAAQHCVITSSSNDNFLKEPLRTEDVLVIPDNSLQSNNPYNISASDLYPQFVTDRPDLLMGFDDQHWQPRSWNPTTGYEQWMTNTSILHSDANASEMMLTHAPLDWQALSHPTVIQTTTSALPAGTGHVDEATVAAVATAAATAAATMAQALLPPSSSASSTASSSSSTMSTGSVLSVTKTARSGPPGINGAVEKPYMKRNRKTEHPVWEFFKRTSDGNAQCAICQGVVKSPCSSNFMRHLMRHHSNEYNAVYFKWVAKRGPSTKETKF